MCVGTNGFWWSLSNLQKEGLDSLIMKQRCRGSQGKIWTKHCFVRTHVDMLISSCDGESQRTVICFWACISYRLLTKWGNAKQQCYRKVGWGGGYLQAKTTHSVLSSDQMLKWLTVKHSLSVFILKQLCVLDLWQLPSMFLLWTGLHFSCNLSFKLWLWVSPDWMTQSKTQESSGALLLARVGEVKQTS